MPLLFFDRVDADETKNELSYTWIVQGFTTSNLPLHDIDWHAPKPFAERRPPAAAKL